MHSDTTRNSDPDHRIYSSGGLELESDLCINQIKLLPSSISSSTAELNRSLQKLTESGPKWYHVGAPEYRLLRKRGLTQLPGATLLSSATSLAIPSRDDGRSIPCRIIKPRDSNVGSRGIFLHLHGGGWVLNDEESSDVYLQTIADTCQLTCVSLGYRLAPEHPFPAAPNDCVDGAQWIIDNASEIDDAGLAYIGGESAGANLALLTALAILRSPLERYANFQLKGLMLHFGVFSLQWQPGTRYFKRTPALILDESSLRHFRQAYSPDPDPEFRTSPQVSPFFADLAGLQLPAMLLTCGTEDCLLEDSLFMGVRWLLAGGKATLKLYPGSPHGFILFPLEKDENARGALRDVALFVKTTFS
ncbi:hypothetical protein BHE90_015292 [Fusarium euwallaceae]|uniref:Alpha/beta hydrolase fold-3 domain-containing protein n=1 Tax=Fusarium euwallaceae TaxID=1147111 RepID=A0A430L3J0_9HYPO|nr:hypothetical protein BHE90_015292 [Fusarium euwallaceae]